MRDSDGNAVAVNIAPVTVVPGEPVTALLAGEDYDRLTIDVAAFDHD